MVGVDKGYFAYLELGVRKTPNDVKETMKDVFINITF